ncbi:hypothetical protein MRB53_031643 [Persea americana]|uniref:Uncharacterized protein n=1 Tax=Persea americana TaxID=3435 RepID=A0ACC2KQ27_PERAE|nr:hypothetical protein MRB53_031643 [Persea americana]|eukprot:TRINITY_DN4939_c1_g1_i10.p1 TRINITY_DN4939_c1_g1~~TRINITY_DN4939_c1_g1_i10.p1  ORF type:complete len:356 (-),score=57.18 TRINITY_DN4939_c1_g1_i10:224-1291(-)
METYLSAGRFPTQSLRSSPRSSAFSNSRKASLFHGTVCNFQPEMEKKTLNLNRMFIFGMGFVGLSFAHELKRHGWEISGTCTTVAKKMKLEEMGFNPILFNASDPELKSLNPLQGSSHLLISIPPIDGLGDPVLSLHQDIIRRILGNGNVQWMGYLSSTSVYGDCGGAWVDEDYPINATSERAKARLAAEKGWLHLGNDLDIPAYVFRLGGIYGPGRSALDTIIKHETLSKSQKMRESRNYISRVHVADICQALIASMVLPSSSSSVYNVVDDNPAPRAEVFAFAQTLIQERWSGHIMECSSLDRSDVAIEVENVKTGKRVSNARLKQELGVSLLHPTYRSGLQSIAETMNHPFR